MISRQSISFAAHGLRIAGILRLPEGAAGQKNPAIVCVHPGGGCKEQTAGLYAEKLAEQGFVTLAFDASCQGESEGEPRFIENPYARVEDIRCAVDHLTTLDAVDETRVGVLGICAGGGYAASAAMTERRIRAVGTVAAVNIGRMYRESGDPLEALTAIARQRTAEARGAALLVAGWIPGSQEEREQAGLTDQDFAEAVDYYRTARGQHPHSPNKLYYTSLDAVYGFDAFHLADRLLTQPLQIIVGGKAGAIGSFKDGHTLYETAASSKKDLFVLETVSHVDLYDQPAPVKCAMEKLTAFYKENL